MRSGIVFAALLVACAGTIDSGQDAPPAVDLAVSDDAAMAEDASPPRDAAPADIGIDLWRPAADLWRPDAAAPPADLATLVCQTKGARDCSPGSGTGTGPGCTDFAAGLFSKQANAAIEKVLADNPSWFDYTQGFPCCPVTVQPDAYVLAVVANLQAAGLCAERDPNDGHEISVKLQNDCAENYNVLTSGNVVRHPPKYQGTCGPAYF